MASCSVFILTFYLQEEQRLSHPEALYFKDILSEGVLLSMGGAFSVYIFLRTCFAEFSPSMSGSVLLACSCREGLKIR